MPKPLKNLPMFWDPGRTKLLHASRDQQSVSIVIAQAPHRQDTLMSPSEDVMEWEIITLPLPYTYYFLHVEGYYDQINCQVKGIACSPEFKDLRVDNVNILPLPNTGLEMYTCSMPFQIENEEFIRQFYKKPNPELSMPLVREIAKAAICHFWMEGFLYHEKVTTCHKNLYIWGGAGVKEVGDHADINMDVYKKWSKLKLDELMKMPWMRQKVSKPTTAIWM